MRIVRSVCTAIAACGIALAATGAVRAESYPSRPIRMIVPFAAGGPADTMARLVAQQLASTLRQTVVIDNRPGAGGTLGAKAATSAEADGYTLMFGNTATLAIGPVVYASAGYDPMHNTAFSTIW